MLLLTKGTLRTLQKGMKCLKLGMVGCTDKNLHFFSVYKELKIYSVHHTLRYLFSFRRFLIIDYLILIFS